MKKIKSVEITEECYLPFMDDLYVLNAGDQLKVTRPTAAGPVLSAMAAREMLMSGVAEVGETEDYEPGQTRERTQTQKTKGDS